MCPAGFGATADRFLLSLLVVSMPKIYGILKQHRFSSHRLPVFFRLKKRGIRAYFFFLLFDRSGLVFIIRDIIYFIFLFLDLVFSPQDPAITPGMLNEVPQVSERQRNTCAASSDAVYFPVVPNSRICDASDRGAKSRGYLSIKIHR